MKQTRKKPGIYQFHASSSDKRFVSLLLWVTTGPEDDLTWSGTSGVTFFNDRVISSISHLSNSSWSSSRREEAERELCVSASVRGFNSSEIGWLIKSKGVRGEGEEAPVDERGEGEAIAARKLLETSEMITDARF